MTLESFFELIVEKTCYGFPDVVLQGLLDWFTDGGTQDDLDRLSLKQAKLIWQNFYNDEPFNPEYYVTLIRGRNLTLYEGTWPTVKVYNSVRPFLITLEKDGNFTINWTN